MCSENKNYGFQIQAAGETPQTQLSTSGLSQDAIKLAFKSHRPGLDLNFKLFFPDFHQPNQSFSSCPFELQQTSLNPLFKLLMLH